MIRQLANPFKGGAPDAMEEYLEHSSAARGVAFNRPGTLLAVGYTGGQVIIWDFETRGVAKELAGGHGSLAEVTALSWSSNGRTLATAGTDSQLLLWDVLSGRVTQRVKLPSAAVSVQLHPGGAQLALVCCTGEAAPHVVYLGASRPSLGEPLPLGTPPGEATTANAAPASRKGAQGTCAAVFTACGQSVFAGTATGVVSRVRLAAAGSNAASAVVEHCQRVCPVGVPVRHLTTVAGVGETGREMLAVTTGGRHVYVFDTTAGEGQRSEEAWSSVCGCEDPVGKGTWACAALSSDAAWLCTALKGAGTASHIIHVWDVAHGGKLRHVLEGPAECGAATRLAWHPKQSVLLSLGAAPSGRVLLWAPQRAENWSAFAPDFRELEENEEYVEREDEFDVPPAGMDSDQPHGASQPQQGSQAPLDVFTLPPPDGNEPADALLYLPLQPRPPEQQPPANAGVPISSGGREAQHEGPVQQLDPAPEQQPGKRMRAR